MKAPEADAIKNEIDKISGRIDNILKTVQKYYPVTETETARENNPGSEAQPEKFDCHLKQKPDQEA
ncbi:MAG: hypothetical protein ACOC8I_02395 [Desulfosalsimonas sp.]